MVQIQKGVLKTASRQTKLRPDNETQYLLHIKFHQSNLKRSNLLWAVKDHAAALGTNCVHGSGKNWLFPVNPGV